MATSPAAVLGLVPLLAMLAIFARERTHACRDYWSSTAPTAARRSCWVTSSKPMTATRASTARASWRSRLTVAERLELSPTQRRNLEFGALLHDIGKIAIPKQIINKPGPLDPDEWAIIKTHTIEGQKMLDRVGGFMHEVGLIVRSHHERWDGAATRMGSPARRSRSKRGSSRAVTHGTQCAPTASIDGAHT